MGNKLPNPNPFIKTGSVVLITGASSGLGRELALQFSHYPVRMMITGRNKDRLAETKKLCQENKAIAIEQFLGDLNSPSACEQLINHTIETYMKIDYLVLNAGVNAHFSFAQLQDITLFEKLMKTNFYSNVYLTKYALPYLRKSRSHILVISSMSGKLGLPDRSAYCASKFALSGFFESLRTEEESISITQVFPTSLDTPMRENDLLGHKNADKSSKNKQQSASQTAKYIILKIKPGQNDIYIPIKMWLGTVVQPLFPNFIRNKARQAAKL